MQLSKHRVRTLWILLGAAMLVGAGCLSSVGQQTKEAVGASDAAEAQARSNATAGGGDEALATGTREVYASALSSLGEDDAITRYAIDGDAAGLDGSARANMSLLFDAEKDLVVISIRNESTAPPSDGDGISQPKLLLIGQVRRTTLIGTPKAVISSYNQNASLPQENFTVDNLYTGGERAGMDSDAATGPGAFLEAIEGPPPGASITSAQITYHGEPAEEIQATFQNGSRSIDVRVVVLEDPRRPALIEGTIEDPSAGDDAVTGDFSMRFTYGADATHPYEERVLRAATLALGAPEDQSMFSQPNETKIWTVQPSETSKRIALDDVEVLVTESSSGSSPSPAEPVARLPAENGSIDTEAFDVRYVDADADGYVSSGDQVEFTPRTQDAASYTVGLHDEATGMRVAPGAGVWSAIAALTGALAWLRRR